MKETQGRRDLSTDKNERSDVHDRGGRAHNRQVWAATLGELARRGDVGRAELDTWLRPAALIGRDGETLILGAPNAVSRDRIATRLLPAVREALGATIGARVSVSGRRGRRAPCRVKRGEQRWRTRRTGSTAGRFWS